MLESKLFRPVLCWLGIVSGASLTAAGAFFLSPALAPVFVALSFAVPLAWVWMVWTGIVTWRAPVA